LRGFVVENKGSPMTKKIRIVLIDDHAVVRAGLRMLIGSQADMEVTGEASSAAMAAKSARAFSKSPA